jgi:hypothetical protein
MTVWHLKLIVVDITQIGPKDNRRGELAAMVFQCFFVDGTLGCLRVGGWYVSSLVSEPLLKDSSDQILLVVLAVGTSVSSESSL